MSVLDYKVTIFDAFVALVVAFVLLAIWDIWGLLELVLR